MVEFLLENGARVNSTNNRKETALHLCFDTELAELLITKGATVLAKDVNGFTALHNAVLRNDINMLEFLIKKGAAIDALDKNRETPLHLSLLRKDVKIEIAKLLIEKGANVNAVNKDGATSLHDAIFRENSAMVKFLLSKGADVTIKYSIYDDAVSYAKRCDTVTEIIQLLERAKEAQEAQKDQDEGSSIDTNSVMSVDGNEALKTNKLSPFSKFKLIVLIILPFLPLIITGLAGLMIGLSHIEKVNQSLGFMKEIQSFTLDNTNTALLTTGIIVTFIVCSAILFCIAKNIFNKSKKFEGHRESIYAHENDENCKLSIPEIIAETLFIGGGFCSKPNSIQVNS
jgi:hypothetical protein